MTRLRALHVNVSQAFYRLSKSRYKKLKAHYLFWTYLSHKEAYPFPIFLGPLCEPECPLWDPLFRTILLCSVVPFVIATQLYFVFLCFCFNYYTGSFATHGEVCLILSMTPFVANQPDVVCVLGSVPTKYLTGLYQPWQRVGKSYDKLSGMLCWRDTTKTCILLNRRDSDLNHTKRLCEPHKTNIKNIRTTPTPPPILQTYQRRLEACWTWDTFWYLILWRRSLSNS